MEFEWVPEQPDLGALGLAGICRETSRVIRRAILADFDNLGPSFFWFPGFLLASAVACSALSSRVGDGDGHLRLVYTAACFLLEIYILGILPLYTAAYVLCVASLYRKGGVLKEDLPVFALTRLVFTCLLMAVPFLVVSTSPSVAGALIWLSVETVLPLRLLGWASAAYVVLVWQLACVVSVLEDAALFVALRRSQELLAGKFWAAACVFVTLDGCIIALLKAFPALVLDDTLGLGLAFQVAAGAGMLVALCSVLLVTMVAQPVVYMVCKSHRQEVVDKAHPTNLAVDGDI